MWEQLRDETVRPILAEYGMPGYHIPVDIVAGVPQEGAAAAMSALVVEESHKSGDKDSVRHGAKKLLTSAGGGPRGVKPGDVIQLLSRRWYVVDARPIAPAGVSVAFEVFVK